MAKKGLPVWTGQPIVAKPTKKPKRPEPTLSKYAENMAHGVGEELVRYQYPLDLKLFNGIMFVAEAPGEQEARERKPLVGTSGQKFNGWLAQAKIEREYSIIANTFRFRPNNNRVDNFFVGPRIAQEQKIETAPLPPCRGKLLKKYFQPEIRRLLATIAKYKPHVVVTMGGIATWAVIGRDDITNIQGSICEQVLGPDDGNHHFYVLPCFHPSSALPFRSPQNEQSIIETFARARNLSKAVWRKKQGIAPPMKPDTPSIMPDDGMNYRPKRRLRK